MRVSNPRRSTSPSAARPSSTWSTTTWRWAGHRARAVRAAVHAAAIPRRRRGRGDLPKAGPRAPPRVARDRPRHVPVGSPRRRDVRDRDGDGRLGGQPGHHRLPPVALAAGGHRAAGRAAHRPGSATRHRLRRRRTRRRRCRTGLLDELGYSGFPKTSGGRGIHVYVRIEPRWTFTEVRHAAIAFARELERRMPTGSPPRGGRRSAARRCSSTTTRTPATARSPRPTALRAAPGATVSTPVTWDELRRRRPAGVHAAHRARAVRLAGRLARGYRRRRTDSRRCSSGLVRSADRGGDTPYPPKYPKMPGEPKRVQPSKRTPATRSRSSTTEATLVPIHGA